MANYEECAPKMKAIGDAMKNVEATNADIEERMGDFFSFEKPKIFQTEWFGHPEEHYPVFEWPERVDIDKMSVGDHKRNEYKFGWLTRGAVDSCRFYRNDGTKSDKFGYSGELGIDDKRWVTGTRKIRVGKKHGCVASCWFLDKNGNDVAGGETSEEGWKPSEDEHEEIELKPNQKVVGFLVQADNPVRAFAFVIAELSELDM